MGKHKVSKQYYDMLIKIGLNVAYYRKLKNISQSELAEKTELNRVTISKIESSDKFYAISMNTAFRLAEALEIPVRKLFDFRDERDD